MLDNDKAFDGMPETPSWVFEEIDKQFIKYLRFETIKGGRFYTCTNCHEQFKEGPAFIQPLMSAEDYGLFKATHLSFARCPKCEHDCAVRNVKFQKNTEQIFNCVFIPVAYDDVWVRCYASERSYVSPQSPAKTTHWEMMRYHLRPGKVEFFKKWFKADQFDQYKHVTEPFSWNMGPYCEKYSYRNIFVGGSLKDTFLRYSAYEDAKYMFYSDVPLLKYLSAYALHPQLEMLVKLGDKTFVTNFVNTGRDLSSLLDWSAKTPWGLYRLTHEEYNAWQKEKAGGKLSVYKIFRRLKGKGIKDMALAHKIYHIYYDVWNDGGEKKAYSFIAAVRRLRVDPRAAYKYIEKVQRESVGGCHHCPGITLYEAETLYMDYLKLAEKCGVTKTVSPFPKDLKATHDDLLKEAEKLKNLAKIADAQKRLSEARKLAKKEALTYSKKYKTLSTIYAPLKKKFSYENEKYRIVVPQNIEDILLEGNILGHCIGRGAVERYLDRIKARESFLVFLRQADKPDVPWYTLEVEPDGTIRQKRTFGDQQGKDLDEAFPFLSEWQRTVHKRMTKADKALAEKSKALRESNFAELRQNKTVVRTGHLRGQLLADVLAADLMEVTLEVKVPKVKTKQTRKVG